MADFTEIVIKRNPSDTLIVHTDFYNWLRRPGNYQDDVIECKVAYLESLGFVRGTDRVCADVLRSLGYILETYFRVEVLPQ